MSEPGLFNNSNEKESEEGLKYLDSIFNDPSKKITKVEIDEEKKKYLSRGNTSVHYYYTWFKVSVSFEQGSKKAKVSSLVSSFSKALPYLTGYLK